MKDKTKTTAKSVLRDWGTPSLIIGAIIAGALFAGELKGMIFETEEQRIKTKNHVDTDINPITVFRQADTLSKRTDTVAKRQDTIIIQQKNLDSLLVRQNRFLDSIKNDGRKKIAADSLFNIQKIISINAREHKMDENLRFTKQSLSIMTEILDSLKN